MLYLRAQSARHGENEVGKTRIEALEVSDEFWRRVEPLIPRQVVRQEQRAYVRKPGGGRKPKPARLVFEAIVSVLRTGCQWKALPRERFGSASAIHKRFLEWESNGLFLALWQAGLAEYDDLEGIAWRWQSIDSNDEGAAGTAGCGAQPHGSGGKMAASVTSWSTGVASRCRSS
jgi:transposase